MTPNQPRTAGRTPPEAPPPAPVDALAADVERILCDLLAQIQRLTRLAGERREAMKKADTAGLARCIALENEAVQAVAEIEKRRLTAVGRLAERLGERDKPTRASPCSPAALAGPSASGSSPAPANSANVSNRSGGSTT